MKDFSFWALLPPLYSLSTAAGLWLVYFVAVENKKVAPLSSTTWVGNGSLYPPYISIAGNFPPASCVFSQVMNLSAFTGLLIGLLVFLELQRGLDSVWLNRCSLAAFGATCCGMSLLGNFQLFPQEAVHNLGTALTFGLGTAFCWMQAFISVKVSQRSSWVGASLRLLLSGGVTLAVVLYFWLMVRGLHMHAARCQWALVSFLLLFISTFALEFRHCRFHVVSVDAAARPIAEPELEDMYQTPPSHV